METIFPEFLCVENDLYPLCSKASIARCKILGSCFLSLDILNIQFHFVLVKSDELILRNPLLILSRCPNNFIIFPAVPVPYLFIGRWLLYSVVLASAVPQSGSLYMYPLFRLPPLLRYLRALSGVPILFKSTNLLLCVLGFLGPYSQVGLPWWLRG